MLYKGEVLENTKHIFMTQNCVSLVGFFPPFEQGKDKPVCVPAINYLCGGMCELHLLHFI